MRTCQLAAIIDQAEISKLPRWAIVAFIARCGRRLLPRYVEDSAEPEDQRMSVARAIRLAEERASKGGDVPCHDALEIDGQFIDNYDLDALESALSGCVNAAVNTDADLCEDAGIGMHTGLIMAVASLAKLAFNAAFSCDMSGEKPDLTALAEAAAGWSVFGEKAMAQYVVSDFELICSRSMAQSWNDMTPVSPEAFGELWPDGRPIGWPQQQLSFRARARIIRTIGDRLISGPEAAVIELIKNSHDADATFVRVTFVPPLEKNQGSIIVEDDGHGMSLEDIEEKWMEPATGDKQARRMSPNGRHLLGSKGIGRFATARLGRYLELISSAKIAKGVHGIGNPAVISNPKIQTTRIPQLDWDEFDKTKYLEEVQFPVETLEPATTTGTRLIIAELRDGWAEQRLRKLHEELRRLVSPIQRTEDAPFRILLDLSRCTPEICGFDGQSIVASNSATPSRSEHDAPLLHEVQPFPLLDACDYAVDGVFNEDGDFEGSIAVRRAGLEPEQIRLHVPLRVDNGEEPCGIVLVRLHIFDREATAIRTTAEKAGFGAIGIREARKLLDNICGVAIYRQGFRVRPYGDSENDWLTLDAKRVQNPTMRIGRNQIAGIVVVDTEETSRLVERSSREGLEENGSFRRLQSMLSALLAESVEPRRRQFRISAGLDEREEMSFREIYRKVQLDWSKLLVAKMPEADRATAEALIAKETDRLTAYLKRLEERQAQLEAKVTLGLIIGEVMHQGNTPLSFLETESARLVRWWPRLFDQAAEAGGDRLVAPRLLNGMVSSSGKLRILFNSLSPLSGARRGQPTAYDATAVIAQTQFLFKTRLENLGVCFSIVCDNCGRKVFGHSEDLSTAMTNLIDNSIYWLEYHKIKPPTITVTISSADDHCRIDVADNGVGVPKEFAEQVFDVGFTLKPHGTGLGLSIAKEAIMRSSGDLQLLAAPVGAVFQISLPYEK